MFSMPVLKDEANGAVFQDMPHCVINALQQVPCKLTFAFRSVIRPI